MTTLNQQTANSSSGARQALVAALYAICALMLLLTPATTFGQTLDNNYHKTGYLLRHAFNKVAAASRQSTVRIVDGQQDLAYGVVVKSDGWILTKASQIKPQMTCLLANGRRLDAVTKWVSRDDDLALLKVEAHDLPVVQWSDKPPQVGQWTITAGISEVPLSMGIVSVPARQIPERRGVLGVAVVDTPDGPKVIEVVAQSGAENAGLKIGDLVMEIQHQRMKTAEDVTRTVRSFRPGELVVVKVTRNGKLEQLSAVLGDRLTTLLSRGKIQGTSQDQISRRRTGFPEAIQHDSVLTPEQCGGPLVDLDGRVVGLNIARLDRTASIAIPAERIRELLREWNSPEAASSKVWTVYREPNVAPVEDDVEPVSAAG